LTKNPRRNIYQVLEFSESHYPGQATGRTQIRGCPRMYLKS
jgi:hypothetical protein